MSRKNQSGLSIGELRHRINIIRQTGSVPNQFGEAVPSEATFGPYWSKIESLDGKDDSKELWNNDQVQPQATHLITLRGGILVLVADRIIHKGRSFEVVGVTDPDGRGIKQTVRAIEKK